MLLDKGAGIALIGSGSQRKKLGFEMIAYCYPCKWKLQPNNKGLPHNKSLNPN
jgi:hypothetical protein